MEKLDGCLLLFLAYDPKKTILGENFGKILK